MKKNNLKTIKYCFKISKKDFIVMLFLGILNCFINVISIFCLNNFIENLQNNTNNSFFSMNVIIPFFIYIGTLILIFLYNKFYCSYWIQFKSIPNFERKCTSEIHKKSLLISNEEFYKSNTANITAYAIKSSVNLFRLTQIFIFIFISLLNAILITLYISSFNYIFLIFIVISVIPSFVEMKIQDIHNKKYRKELIDLNNLQYALFDSLIEVDATKESQLFELYKLINEKHIKLLEKRNSIIHEKNVKILKFSFILSFLKVVGTSAGIILSTCLLFFNKIDVAGFSVGVSAYALMLTNFKNLLDLLISQKQFETLNKPFFEYFDFRERKGELSSRFHDKIELKNVSFAYQNKPVLKNISMTIHKGDKIAIVGVNGAGKTTLVNIILGNYITGDGVVLYDGIPIENIKESMLHANQTVIQQNILKYNISLNDNISFGNDNDKLDDVLSQLDLDVKKDELLGLEFGGRELSGGQWQRIVIERGFYKDADLYVLDEPTSAIDPIKENELYTSFNNRTKDKTCITITHKLGSIKNVDKIYVLDNGELVEEGSHEDLIHKKGLYYNMWITQTDFINN